MGKKRAAVEVRSLDIGELVTARLDTIHVSPHNVRKIEINDLGALRASIVEQGLLQPLVGYIQNELTYVAAGQRRLLAMQGLMRDGILAPDTHVPVRIVDETTAIEVSLAENIERKDMNPADEVRAFKALVDTGTHDATTIAKRFGFDVKLVRRRLKMAVLHEEILAALQDGAITVNAAEAYASTSDQAVQLKIFKEQAKSSWKPHDVGTILRAVLSQGFLATGSLGKFIGGRKAYEKAGGEIATDDSFMPLFEAVASPSALEEVRLTDLEVLDKLANAKMATLHKKVLDAATAKYPFITGIEWVDMFGVTQYGSREVKLPKKSECKLVKAGYDGSTYLDRADVVKRAKKAAEKQNAICCAVIDIDKDGQPVVREGEFVVGKDGWAKTAPKEKKDDTPTLSSMTPEEREAHDREQRARTIAANLLGRSLIGPTPGYLVVGIDVRYDYRSNKATFTIDMAPEDPAVFDEVLIFDNYNGRIKPEALEPFMEEARARVATIEAEQAIGAAKAEAEEAEAQDAANALLDELETTAIADWPARVVIEGDDFGSVIIERGQENELICSSSDGETWSTDNVLETLATIRDGLAEAGAFTVSREEEAPQAEMQIPSNDECKEDREPAVDDDAVRAEREAEELTGN
jgi:ParB/RepB/Spo0J family partition protein